MATKAQRARAKAAEAEAAADAAEEELEDLEESEEAEEGPKVAANQPDPEFGTKQLIALIKEQTGREYSGRDLRNLIRRLYRNGTLSGREISRENPQRYSWSGPDDPQVKKIVKAVKSGAIESARTEALDELKKRGQQRRAEKKAAREKAKAESLGDDDEDEEEEDSEED